VEQAVREVSLVLGERQACELIGVVRSTFQRHRFLKAVSDEMSSLDIDGLTSVDEISEAKLSRQLRRYLARQERKTARVSFRALTPDQRQEILDAVHEPRFTDRSVPYIYATLLDETASELTLLE
jgi:hypothetical protein